MRALALAVLLAALPAAGADVGRYQLSCRTDGTTFVLDTASGRVWRYDRVDDAWYLYDLEALVGKTGRAHRAEPPVEGKDKTDKDAGQE